jgi:hypothetical protein
MGAMVTQSRLAHNNSLGRIVSLTQIVDCQVLDAPVPITVQPSGKINAVRAGTGLKRGELPPTQTHCTSAVPSNNKGVPRTKRLNPANSGFYV